MSKESQENSFSSKPKYVYLDKFNRYMVRTDTMLQQLESQNEKNVNQIRTLSRELKKLRTICLSLAFAVAVLTIVVLFVL
jgi:hypothetical protein